MNTKSTIGSMVSLDPQAQTEVDDSARLLNIGSLTAAELLEHLRIAQEHDPATGFQRDSAAAVALGEERLRRNRDMPREIWIAGQRVLQGDAMTTGMLVGNLDGSNFAKPRPGHEQTHGMWLEYMEAFLGRELPQAMPFIEQDDGGDVRYRGLIGLSLQLHGKEALLHGDRLIATEVAQRISCGEKGDDLPILMEAFGCNYDEACEQIFSGRHLEALAEFAKAVMGSQGETDWGRYVQASPLADDVGTAHQVRYVVLGEHTLGYLQEGTVMMGVLAGSVIKGGHSWKNGPVAIVPGYTQLRPATLSDFEVYRVLPPPGFAESAAPDEPVDETQAPRC